MVNTIAIDFSVYAQTSPGEQVWICGNALELGNWNISKALKLQTSKQIYPQWRTRNTLFFTQNIPLQFKALITNSTGNVRWQKIQGNRKLVPTSSILINFTQSKMEMVVQPKIIREEFGIRKNTFEMSDQMSQSSSGNQKQFWLERAARQRSSVNYAKQFVTQAKNLYQNWTKDTNPPLKLKQKQNNEWNQIVQSTHYIIKKLKNQLPSIYFYVSYLSHDDNNPTQPQYQIQKKSNLKIHIINKNNIDNYIINNKDYSKFTLKLFHISSQDYTEEIQKKIYKIFQGYFIVYVQHIDHNSYKFLEQVQMITISNKSVLKECLEYYASKQNYSISILKDNQFLINKPFNQFTVIYFSTHLPSLDDQSTITYQYLSALQKRLLNQKHFPLPDNLRLCLLIQKHNILKNVHKQKFTIVILCQKISQISSKSINWLIRISNCQNIQIYIMSNQQISQINKKLPCSKKDKILVYNIQGVIYKPEKKCNNLYDQIRIVKNKYNQIFKIIKNKTNYWIQNGEVNAIIGAYTLKFQCNNDILGQQISQYLLIQLSKLDTNIKYSYQIQKYYSSDKKNIIIQIRPTISSSLFFSKIITSLNQVYPINNYFITFDYTKNIHNFIDKMNRNCKDKKYIHEGFIIASCNSKKGLKEDKFQQFLKELFNQSETSIIQDQQDRYDKNKVIQKDIKSDFQIDYY